MDSNVQRIIDSFISNQVVDGDKYTIMITDKHLDYPGPTILFIAGDIHGLTGYDATELVDKSPRLLQGPGTDRALMTRLRLACQNGDYFECDVINYRKDGLPFVMSLAISPIRIGGNIEYYFAIQSDTTGEDARPMLTAVKTRVDRINLALDEAKIKLTNSVEKIGQLLALAARLQRRKKLDEEPAQPVAGSGDAQR